jgi:hypothetical protein
MMPFRAYDREKKQMWVILNYHPGQDGGSYLAAKETDDEEDGVISLLPFKDMGKFKLVDFLDNE